MVLHCMRLFTCLPTCCWFLIFVVKISCKNFTLTNAQLSHNPKLSCLNYALLFPNLFINSVYIYSVSQNKSPPRLSDFFHFFQKRLRIFQNILTHLLCVPMYVRLQIFIQLSPTLTKLCHIKRVYLVHIICAKCPKRARSDVCASRW